MMSEPNAPSSSLATIMADSSRDVILLLRPDGRIVEANAAAVDAYGYSLDELREMTVAGLRPADTLQDISRQLAIADGPGALFETRLRRKDGSEFPVEISSRGVTVGGEQFLVSVVRDITERKLAEQALLESEERFRKAFMTGLDAFYIATLDGMLVECNAEFEKLFGYSKEELLGRTSLELNLYADPAERTRMLAEIEANGQAKNLEMTGRRKNGELIDCSLSVSVVTISNTPHLLGVLRDITQRTSVEAALKESESRLRQAQKIEAMGRLAGGLAHDFNNMLAVILGYVEIALGQLAPDAAIRPELEQIQSAAKRSAELTSQLLAFARKQTIQPRTLDLNHTVGEMLKMLQRLIGENIDLSWKPGGLLWPVRMDPSQLDQVLVNVAVNARDAIGGVGIFTLETRNVTFGAAECQSHPGLVPGAYVELSAADTGCGMAPEVLSKAFEPFFTTKGLGLGTGLGLSTVYGIVKQNGGYVMLESEPGRGTAVRIYLPRDDVPSHERLAQPAGDVPVRGHETVLVVEDSAPVRSLTTRLLTSLGYLVVSAATPTEAIRVAEAHTGPLDLLVTDVVLPEMNGRELWTRIVQLRPGTRCLFMSGYTHDIISEKGVLASGVHFVQKPFSASSLGNAVREALDD